MSLYLDCAATTPIEPAVRARVLEFLDESFGNAGSRTHGYGRSARRAVEQARDRVAELGGARRSEVVFTSGATESNNLAILGLAGHGRERSRRHIVTTAIEHKAVLEPVAHLERHGFTVTYVAPRPGGRVDDDELARALRDDTLLVSVMHVNNETGVIQPVSEIARRLDGHPAYFHVDAAQSFGKLIAPLRDARIDLVSVSGHKLFAPKGVGALIARRRDDVRPPLEPLMHGGGQEHGLRPGTLAVPLIAGLGKACELALAHSEARAATCRAIKAGLVEALRPLRPEIHGDPEHTVPHVMNFAVPGVDAEEAMEELDGIAAVSNGSACTAESESCSHVLAAMGVPPVRSEGALRFSWCHLTEVSDWEPVVAVLRRLQHEARAPAASTA